MNKGLLVVAVGLVVVVGILAWVLGSSLEPEPVSLGSSLGGESSEIFHALRSIDARLEKMGSEVILPPPEARRSEEAGSRVSVAAVDLKAFQESLVELRAALDDLAEEIRSMVGRSSRAEALQRLSEKARLLGPATRRDQVNRFFEALQASPDHGKSVLFWSATDLLEFLGMPDQVSITTSRSDVLISWQYYAAYGAQSGSLSFHIVDGIVCSVP